MDFNIDQKWRRKRSMEEIRDVLWLWEKLRRLRCQETGNNITDQFVNAKLSCDPYSLTNWLLGNNSLCSRGSKTTRFFLVCWMTVGSLRKHLVLIIISYKNTILLNYLLSDERSRSATKFVLMEYCGYAGYDEVIHLLPLIAAPGVPVEAPSIEMLRRINEIHLSIGLPSSHLDIIKY